MSVFTANLHCYFLDLSDFFFFLPVLERALLLGGWHFGVLFSFEK